MNTKSLLKSVFSRPSRQKPVQRRRPALALESLEERCVPAVFLVNTTADTQAANLTTGQDANGNISLRSALEAANASGGGSQIDLTVAGDYRIAAGGQANTGSNSNGGAFVILPSSGGVSITNTSGGFVAVDGAGLDRVFDINPQDTDNPSTKITVTLSGFTIENGLAQPGDGPAGSGGGIRDQGNTSLTLNNVIVTDNAASADGGGISMENTASTPWTLTINNSTISFNRAGDAGGGVEEDGSGKVNITNSHITGNTTVNQGGGIWLDAIGVETATLNVTQSLIDNNNASAGPGGGIGQAGNSTVNVTSSTIDNNFAFMNGGGFGDQNGLGTLVLVNDTIVNNTAVGNGGGVSEDGPSTTIQDCTITGNSSQSNGGGIESASASFVLNNTIVAGDFAGTMNFAGGVTAVNIVGNFILPYSNSTVVIFTNAAGDTTGSGAAGTPTIVNGLITGVTITNPGTGYQLPPTVEFGDPIGFGGFGLSGQTTIAGAAPDIMATVTSGAGNFIGIGDLNLAGITNGVNGNQIGTHADPLVASLSPLGNYGGATPTQIPLTGSLVIGKGVSGVTPATDPVTGVPLTDQRGFSRVIHGGTGVILDVGAVQSQPLVLKAATLPIGTEGMMYPGATFEAAGGSSSTYSFAVTNGALPIGLSLNSATGMLTGTGTAAGLYSFTITVTDSIGDFGSQTYNVRIIEPSQYEAAAYSYTNQAYLAAFDAYVTGTGSYNAFYYEYLANFYATDANNAAAVSDAFSMQNYAYYAYYYGYFGEQYAFSDYVHSGEKSMYSYQAYYDAYFGSTYSFYTAEGY